MKNIKNVWLELFEASEINGLRLKNRFIRSGTWTGLATADGACTPRLTRLLAGLARGGAGLIITGHTYVHNPGKAGPWQLGIDTDALIPGLRRMVTAIHRHNGKIMVQLSHSGIYGNPNLTGRIPLAASKLDHLVSYPVKQMGEQDIRGVIEEFAAAATRARRAGFDGIQIHAAHGYLMNQFLSRAFNHRTDEFGGRLENRARVLVSTVRRVRRAVGRDFPLFIKLNSSDGLKDGLTVGDAVKIAAILEAAGVDAIEVSGGSRASGHLKSHQTGIEKEADEAYFEAASREIKAHVHIPVILVGGIRSHAVAERLVRTAGADYVSMSRPFIREPDLVNRWKAGHREAAACISDNRCMGPGLRGEGIRCLMTAG